MTVRGIIGDGQHFAFLTYPIFIHTRFPCNSLHDFVSVALPVLHAIVGFCDFSTRELLRQFQFIRLSSGCDNGH
jgi:hypothetical protein